MKPALRSKKPIYPTSWEQLPAGPELQSHIEDCLSEDSRRFFGYHFVKVGCLSGEINLPSCTIKHIINVVNPLCVEAGKKNKASLLIADPHDLPLAENSVDAFLLALELDFSRDPHQIVREVARSLIPNGHLVIVGFNPFSLAGLFRFLPLKSNTMLRQARFFSSMRIKDWLHLLGFEVVEQHQLIFSSLMLKHQSPWLLKIEKLCRRYLPIFSSIYVIVAKKRVVPLSLIKPKWKPSPKFSTVSASMRNSLKSHSQLK